MPGLVVGVSVQAGQHVDAGSPVVVLEAMKMQNELTAKGGGTVREVRVAVGDKVERGAVLAMIES
jgi:propionyl-CoA carboxylase alpha chain